MPLELALDTGSGTLRSNPARDIAHFWPEIVGLAIHGLQEKNWESWYRGWCQAHRVHEGHLLRAHAAMAQAVELAKVPDLRSPYAALEAAKFFDEPAAAQLVVIGKIGQLGYGAFWAGVRSAWHDNENPANLQTLGHFARQAQADLNQRWGAAE